jgi:hypothetical protein
MTEPLPTDDVAVVHSSTITCPHCGQEHKETMPDVSCSIFYTCAGCGAMLRPAEGDCCVYCTYGNVPCPAIQRMRNEQRL